MKLVLWRTPWSKETTPDNLKEYHTGIGSPVGNINEVKEHYKNTSIKTIVLMDKQRTKIEHTINL
jgi:hypothetical protein